MKQHLLSALTLALVAGAAHAETGAGAAANNRKTPVLSSGIATEFIEPSVRPQDDFFEYLNGKWLKTVEIPADKSSWGSFAKLRDDTLPQLRTIIERAANDKNAAAGSETQKIGDFYASYMDEARLETLGISPLNAELAKIAAIKDKAELPALLARYVKLGLDVPVVFYIHQDAKDSTKYVADLYQAGL
ncbi:MAG: putative endopeptidase, partial [Massilia sp.]